MFGYVRFSKGEMKVKEYETYRAVYCSLCKYMGKKYGVISRLTLSYDFTFLAVLNIALSENCPAFKGGRCTFNPLKKCNYCKENSDLDMPAAAAVITVYNKVLDNIKDKRGIKKLPYILIKPFVSAMRKKAAKAYPNIDNYLKAFMENQAAVEAAAEQSLDKAADPTAKALGFLLTLCSADKTQKRVLERIGYCIGRYIYLLDAACDFEEDKTAGTYNVLSFSCKERQQAAKRVIPQLYTSVNEAAKAFELLALKRYKPILGNIIYVGLEETFQKELKYEQSV